MSNHHLFIPAQSLAVQKKVIEALFLRELKTRFGDKRLGFFWVFLEPALHLMMFVAVWALLGRLGPQNINPILYLITGIMPYLLFTSTVTKVMKAIAGNRALLVFPQIRPLDFVLTRMLMEFTTYTIVFIGFIVTLRFIGIQFEIKNVLGLIGVFTLTVLLGGGIGLFLTPFVSMFPMIDYGVKMTIRIMYLTSGVFFSLERLPHAMLQYVTWNPLLHIIQQSRSDFFPQLVLKSEYSDLTYVMSLTAAFWLLGMILFRKLFKYIIEE